MSKSLISAGRSMGLLVLSSALSVCGSAQTGTLSPAQSVQVHQVQSNAASLAGAAMVDQPADSAGYILGTGDQLSVRVFGADELAAERPIEVGYDGKINVPMVGKVQASGVSVRSLEADLTKRYSTYFKDPQVSVAVTDYRSEPVTVVGAVNAPNVIQLRGPTRLMHVISQAGGLRPDAGDRVLVTRQLSPDKSGASASGATGPNANFYLKEVDLLKIIDGTDPSADVVIQANDLITVPKAKMVYVVGDVGRPGGYVLDGHSNSLTVLQAIALAGGVNKTAKSGDTKILRTATGTNSQRVESQIDLKKVMASQAPDVALHADDILFVPNSAARNAGIRALEMAVNVGTGLAIWRF
jgi:polysaccharide biosynthesis/export protein